MRITTIDEQKLAGTGEDYLTLLGSNADWIARTPEDLEQLRDSNTGAFAKLTDSEFGAFLESLRFNRGGVAHGNYRPLMNSLTLTEIFEVFARFGMSPQYVLRIHEYSCSAGACTFSFWDFCASNCDSTVQPPG